MSTPRKDLDPITLEVLRNALEATAQEMGAVLKLTAFSTNIKERMDASCAIFRGRGDTMQPLTPRSLSDPCTCFLTPAPCPLPILGGSHHGGVYRSGL